MGISSSTLAYISIGASAIGTGMSVIGAHQQAKAEKSRLAYQAAIARNNKTLAQYKAQDAIQRGKDAKQEHRQKVVQLKGKQRAAIAASGFDVNEDDALDILADTAEIGELDALTIENNAAREAWGYQGEGANAGNQAALYDAQASNINPLMTAGSELFSGVGSVAEKWSIHKRGK